MDAIEDVRVCFGKLGKPKVYRWAIDANVDLYGLTDDFHVGPHVMRRMGRRVELKRKFVLQLKIAEL